MKSLTIIFITSLLVSSCALYPKPKTIKVVRVKKLKAWAEKKRECHTFYLERFGLSTEKAVGICKEELERKHK